MVGMDAFPKLAPWGYTLTPLSGAMLCVVRLFRSNLAMTHIVSADFLLRRLRSPISGVVGHIDQVEPGAVEALFGDSVINV